MHRAEVRRVGVLMVIFFTVSAGLYGQEYRALVSGQVNDPSGRVIPGATVTAVDKATGVRYTAKANGSGTYALNYLLPGPYQLTASAPGFKRKVYSNVTLETGQTLNLDITLTLGKVVERVTVTAAPGLLDTANASSSDVVDAAKVENTPSTGRQVWMTIAFTQGVENLGADPFNLTPRNNTSATYTVNGSGKTDNAFYIDGAPVSDQGVWDFSPNQDAVQEVQVASNPYDARYGEAGGGSFNVDLKSGTNQFHGDFYDYYGNEALNAQGWQAGLRPTPKGINIRNTYGGVLGGPIRKNKTFFFGSFEGFRQDSPASAVESVPPSSWRLQPDGSVNFSGSGVTVYDPLTVFCAKKSASGCSTYGRKAFPNDTIPASRISAQGKALLGLYPLPNAPGSVDNYFSIAPVTYGYDQYLGRVDQNFSQNTRLYAVFGYQRNMNHNPGNQFFNPAQTSSEITGINLMAMADVTRTLSPSLVGDFKLSFVRATSFSAKGVAIAQNLTASKLGLSMPDIPTTTYLNIAPAVSISGFEGLINNTQNGSANNYWNFATTFGQVKGRNVLHYGGLFRDVQTGADGIPGQPNGAFSFNGQWTRENPKAGALEQANALADLLLGYPNSGSVSWNSNQFVTYHNFALFAQDDYRLRPNLTLNLGLRWDIYNSPSERYNRINGGFCFSCVNPYSSQVDFATSPLPLPDPLTGTLTYAGVNGTPRAPFATHYTLFQPRFGIAYAIRPWIVFRGGWGLFDSYGLNATTSSGFDQTTSYINSLNGGLNPTNYFLSGTPYPDGAVAPAGPNQPQAVGVTYDSPGRRPSLSEHWSAGFQWELPKQILLDTEYAGSHTRAIAVSQSWDVISQALRAQCQADPSVCDNPVTNPFYGIVPPQFSLGAKPTLETYQLETPWPIFPSVNQSDDPLGYTNYNALQVRAERKIHTADFVFNYVYSNWMAATNYLNNGIYRDPNLWYGLEGNDRRNYIDADLLWPLPIGQGGILGRHLTGWRGGLLSHWIVDSILTYGSGFPVSIPAVDFYGPGCTSYLPAGGQTRAHWLNNNQACYHALSEWESVTSPQFTGSLRDPSQAFLDGALQKVFTLPKEGWKMQVRLEGVNVLNHPNFGGPNTNYTQAPSCAPPVCTGFGTLPAEESGISRNMIASLKVMF